MSRDFIRALDREIDGLKRDLQGDPKFVKLQELQRVRSLYEISASGGAEDLVDTIWKARQKAQRHTSPDRERLHATLESILKNRTSPTPTSVLLTEVEEQGLVVGGKEPRNTLSALLSHSPKFESHGRSGWMLVELDRTLKNEEAADGESDEEQPSTASSRARFDQPGNPAPLWGPREERG